MKKTHTMPWDPAEHLETDEDLAVYLNVALEEGDLSLIIATLGDIARPGDVDGGAGDGAWSGEPIQAATHRRQL